jgi:cytochrome c-type biogenesis protein
MIPIMLAVAGVQERSTRFHAVCTAAAFVAGMVVVYMTLGLLASLAGIFFNTVAESVVFRVISAAVMAVLGLIVLDVINLNVSFSHGEIARPRGLLGAFALGAVGGIASTGCVLPVLGAVLMVIAAKKEMVFGIVALACFALGMGSVYFACVLLGREAFVAMTRRPLLLQLVKKVLGVIILLFAGYIVYATFA